MRALEKFSEYIFIVGLGILGLFINGNLNNISSDEFTVFPAAIKQKEQSIKNRVTAAIASGKRLLNERLSINKAEVSYEEELIYKEELSRVSGNAKVELPCIYPISGNFKISSGFGFRRDPFTKQKSIHRGIDIPMQHGTPIRATGNGIIVKVGWDKYLGRYVKINHSFGYQSIFGHLSGTIVRKGQKVSARTKIAYSGNTGRSTGPHLHYQINHNGKPVNPVEVVNLLKNR